MSEEERVNEAIKTMKRIKDQLSNIKLNETSSQDNIQEGVRFIYLTNEIYILCQQEKRYFKKRMDQYNNYNYN